MHYKYQHFQNVTNSYVLIKFKDSVSIVLFLVYTFELVYKRKFWVGA